MKFKYPVQELMVDERTNVVVYCEVRVLEIRMSIIQTNLILYTRVFNLIIVFLSRDVY